MKLLASALALTLLALGSFATAAPPPTPNYDEFALIYQGAKKDGAYNAAVQSGLDRLYWQTGVRPRERGANSPEETQATLRNFAERGVGNIMVVGFLPDAAMKEIAAAYPETRFTLIDGYVEAPNIRSVLFREDQAGYLVGIAAGLASRTGRIGFIGGVAIPPVKRFECGFRSGINRVAPTAVLLTAYLGDGFSAFRDAPGAENAARRLMSNGADVLFAAAGYSGIGVMRAAAAAGKLSIGVDVDQNGLFPGSVLTSALKRVDVAAYDSWRDAIDGRWTPGTHILGLEEEGVGWAVDEHNAALVAPMVDLIEGVKADIARGALKLIDYRDNALCRG